MNRNVKNMQLAALECRHTLNEVTLVKNADGNGWTVTIEPPPLIATRIHIEEEANGDSVAYCDRIVLIARLVMQTNYGTVVRDNYIFGGEHVMRMKITRVPKPRTWWDDWRIPVTVYAIVFSTMWVFWGLGQAARSLTMAMFFTYLAHRVRDKLEQKDREEQDDTEEV